MCTDVQLFLGLQEGMVLSDEPGYYEDGSFGIRIETLVKIVPAVTKYNPLSKPSADNTKQYRIKYS